MRMLRLLRRRDENEVPYGSAKNGFVGLDVYNADNIVGARVSFDNFS